MGKVVKMKSQPIGDTLTRYLKPERYSLLQHLYASGERMTDTEIAKKKFKITESDEVLRTRFWDEANACYMNGYESLEDFSIFSGVCLEKDYVAKLKTRGFCLFLLNVQLNYSYQSKSIVDRYGTDFYREVLDLDTDDCVDKFGKRDFRQVMTLCNLKFKVLQHVEKNCNLNGYDKIAIGISERSREDAASSSMSMDTLKKKISDLETELSVDMIPHNPKISKVINADYSEVLDKKDKK